MNQRARELRNSPTEAERMIRHRVSHYRPAFTRQLPIGRYIVDFASRQLKLVVELDGSQHIDNDADTVRTAFLESLGWKAVRFWNSDVMSNADGVADAIINEAEALRKATHPRPLPSREGSREEGPPRP